MSQDKQLTDARVDQNLAEKDGEYEINLMELWYRVLENWKYITGAALVGMVAAIIVTFLFITPIYEADAKLYVLSPGDSVLNLSDLQIGSYLTSDYREVFKTREVNQQVAANLQLNYSYEQLQDMLTVENPSDTRILNIIVASKNPVEAMNIANEYANVARTYIADKMATEEPSILSVAQVPTDPSKPNKKLNTILGFFLGAFVSLGVIVVRFVLDDKIKTADDIRTYVQLSTLAVLPQDDGSVPAGQRATSPKSSTAASRPRSRTQRKG